MKRSLLTAAALAAVAVPAPAGAATTEAKHPHDAGCATHYTGKQFHRAARKVYRQPGETVAERRKLRKMARCQHSPKSARIMQKHRRRYRAAWHRRFYWVVTYNRLSPADKGWARSTGACESGNNPRTNTGNGFLGAFQFLASTARAAGFTTLPHLTSWHEQAVRAVRWRNVAGAGQWPVCGR